MRVSILVHLLVRCDKSADARTAGRTPCHSCRRRPAVLERDRSHMSPAMTRQRIYVEGGMRRMRMIVNASHALLQLRDQKETVIKRREPSIDRGELVVMCDDPVCHLPRQQIHRRDIDPIATAHDTRFSTNSVTTPGSASVEVSPRLSVSFAAILRS